MNPNLNQLTHEVIGAAIEVHRKLGPGLLESAYRKCLCHELFLRGVGFEYELPLPLEYKGIRLESGYRPDIVVAGLVVVEVKSIQALAPIHDAQLLTYLRLGGWRLGSVWYEPAFPAVTGPKLSSSCTNTEPGAVATGWWLTTNLLTSIEVAYVAT